MFAQNTYVAQDTVAWQKGHHSIRFGGGVTRPQDNQVSFQFFGGLIILTPSGLPAGSGWRTTSPTACHLETCMARSTRPWMPLVSGEFWMPTRTSRMITRSLRDSRLNLGLRYERLGDVSDGLGRVANFNQNTADPNPPARRVLIRV